LDSISELPDLIKLSREIPLNLPFPKGDFNDLFQRETFMASLFEKNSFLVPPLKKASSLFSPFEKGG